MNRSICFGFTRILRGGTRLSDRTHFLGWSSATERICAMVNAPIRVAADVRSWRNLRVQPRSAFWRIALVRLAPRSRGVRPRQSFATVFEDHAHHFTVAVRGVAAGSFIAEITAAPPALFVHPRRAPPICPSWRLHRSTYGQMVMQSARLGEHQLDSNSVIHSVFDSFVTNLSNSPISVRSPAWSAASWRQSAAMALKISRAARSSPRKSAICSISGAQR